MAGPLSISSAAFTTARLSTILQILLFLPLTLATLSTPAFLLLSLLLFIHSLIHGTLVYFWGSSSLSFLQVPMHPFLLLVCFNVFSQSVPTVLTTAAAWWGKALAWSSLGFIFVEGLSTLLVVQKLGQLGRQMADEGEGYQFGLLVGAAVAFVSSAWWIASAYGSAATSPLSSTLLGAALTAFLFLTFIGFALRRTNVIESSGLALFLAYNVWLCGLDQTSYWNPPAAQSAPLLSNILPYMQALTNFMTNTLPKPVLIALIYRLVILQLASYIIPTIGTSSWEYDADETWEDSPVSKFIHVVLSYRQAILITVYSHLLLLDHSSQVWWRWMNIFFTLVIWAIELLVGGKDDAIGKEWKVD